MIASLPRMTIFRFDAAFQLLLEQVHFLLHKLQTLCIYKYYSHHGADLFFTMYKQSFSPSVIAYDTERNPTVTRCNPPSPLPSNSVPTSKIIRYTILISRSVILPDGGRRMVPSDARIIAWPIWPGTASRSGSSADRGGDAAPATGCGGARLVIIFYFLTWTSCEFLLLSFSELRDSLAN